PALLLAVPKFGPAGASAVWLALNASYVLVVIPILHHRLLRDQMWRWYRDAVGIPMVTASVAAGLLVIVIPQTRDRVATFVVLAAAGLLVTCMVALATPAMRVTAIQQLAAWRAR